MKDTNGMDSNQHAYSSRVLKLLGVLPVIVFLVLMFVLNSYGSTQSFESPNLLAILNTVFLCVIPLVFAYTSARSYQETSVFGYLMIGCGLVLFGVSSFYAGWVMPLAGGPNPTVTLHNLGSLLAGICQFAGAHFFMRELSGYSNPKYRHYRYEFFYAGIFVLISVIAVLAFQGNLPVFFDPSKGPSLLRQFILSGAVIFFGLAGLVFMDIYITIKSKFAFWYGLSLWLITVGLACIMLQPSVGSLIGWVGRSAQYTGCIYLIVAFLRSRNELSITNISTTAKTGWTLWPYLENRVQERTAELTRLNAALQKEMSERRRAEAKTLHINRLYATISQINQTIVRAQDRDALFSEICRVAIEHGKFRMAWIGLIDECDGKVSPSVFAGEEQGYLTNLSISVHDPIMGGGPTGTAIREERCVICQDIANDPRMTPWREQALKRGFCSSAAVPIRQKGYPVGALTVYASIPYDFDDDDQNLLDEIGLDISFALDLMDTEAERKRAENLLRESEGKWLSLVNSTPDFIALHDSEGKFLFLNHYAEGFTEKDVIGRSLYDFLASESKEIFAKRFEDCLKTWKTQKFEYHGAGSIGTWAVYEEYLVPLVNKNNEVNVLAVARDITERKQIEKALFDSEKRFHDLFDNATIGVYRTTPDGHILLSNPEGWRMLGYDSFEEIAKRNLEEDGFEPGYERSQFHERMNRDGRVIGLESAWMRRDGSVIYVRENAVAVKDTDGNVIYYDGTFEDITERKRMEGELRESEDRYHSLFNVIDEGLAINEIVQDENGDVVDYIILSVNPAFEKHTIYKTEEVLGKRATEVYEMPVEYIREWWRSHSQIQVSAHTEMYHEPSKRWFHVNTTPPRGNRFATIFIDITERKQAEEALRNASSYNRRLIEASIDPLVTIGYDGKITDVNRSTEEATGVQRDQLIGSDFSDYFTEPEKARNGYQQVLAEGQVKDYPLTMCHTSGKTTDVLYNATVYKNANGEVEGVFAAARDITETKRAQLALRLAEADYRTIFEKAPVGIFQSTSEGRFIKVNQTMAEMYGYRTPEEMIEEVKSISKQIYVDASSRQEFQGLLAKYGEMQGFTAKNQRRDGSILWTSTNARIIKAETTQEVIYEGFITDITERKRAELEREQYFNFFQSSVDIMVIADPNGAFLQVNPATTQVLGYSEAELLAKPFLEFIYPDDKQATAIEMERQQKIGNSLNFENRYVCKDGSLIWLSWRAIFVQTEGLTYASASDITERKRNEEVIHQLNAHLEQRVEERTIELVRANHVKDEFLAMMSHELRTPLTSILGFSETLLEGVRGMMTERQQNAVQLIQSSGRHLLNMINDILDISKIESDKFELRPEDADVHEICKSSLVFVKQLAEQKSITVEYTSPAFARTIFADPQRIKQVLINLLSNAVKFTPPNGKVRLEAQTDARAGLVRFSVTDTGIGINPKDLSRLFKPFVQLDSKLSRQYEGTGLGLVLVKKLVEMHGGSIEVRSEVGAGSCFTFVLPWDSRIEKEESLHVPEVGNEQTKLTPAPHAKVLIADDDKATVMLVQDYLGEFGFQVFVAEDGQQVLPKVEEVLPDIILMDIQMPFANGIEVTQRLRSDPRFASVPIIALTAFAMRGDEERCLEAGMNEYLSKPVRLKELRKMIEKLLGNSDD